MRNVKYFSINGVHGGDMCCDISDQDARALETGRIRVRTVPESQCASLESIQKLSYVLEKNELNKICSNENTMSAETHKELCTLAPHARNSQLLFN